MLDNPDSDAFDRRFRRRPAYRRRMGRAVGGDAVIAARIAAAPGSSEADGHALAGFVDAEGSFGIRPNNGGTTWTCSFALCQRADDADLLLDLATVTGIGRLHPVAAQRNSRPQVTWSVNSKLECRELVRLLRRFRLRGRKLREFEVWADAVDAWAAATYDRSRAHWRTLARRADQLRALRCYVDPGRGGDRDDRSPRRELWWFLGGFFSGEGCFELRNTSARASIHLRRDDVALLARLARETGVGSIREWQPSSGPVNPTAVWLVHRRRDLGRLVEIFDAVGLRGRKRREFAAWRTGVVELLAAMREGRRPNAATMVEARRRLVAARAYREGPARPRRLD